MSEQELHSNSKSSAGDSRSSGSIILPIGAGAVAGALLAGSAGRRSCAKTHPTIEQLQETVAQKDLEIASLKSSQVISGGIRSDFLMAPLRQLDAGLSFMLDQSFFLDGGPGLAYFWRVLRPAFELAALQEEWLESTRIIKRHKLIDQEILLNRWAGAVASAKTDFLASLRGKLIRYYPYSQIKLEGRSFFTSGYVGAWDTQGHRRHLKIESVSVNNAVVEASELNTILCAPVDQDSAASPSSSGVMRYKYDSDRRFYSRYAKKERWLFSSHWHAFASNVSAVITSQHPDVDASSMTFFEILSVLSVSQLISCCPALVRDLAKLANTVSPHYESIFFISPLKNQPVGMDITFGWAEPKGVVSIHATSRTYEFKSDVSGKSYAKGMAKTLLDAVLADYLGQR